jgi:hypothetical protein
MVSVKTEVISIIRRANGTTSKSFRTYLNNIHAKHDIKEMHKTFILGTAHILFKV